MKNSGTLHLIAVLILLGALAYAWPEILQAIERGAYEGAKAGAQVATTAALEQTKAEIRDAINEAIPTWAK